MYGPPAVAPCRQRAAKPTTKAVDVIARQELWLLSLNVSEKRGGGGVKEHDLA